MINLLSLQDYANKIFRIVADYDLFFKSLKALSLEQIFTDEIWQAIIENKDLNSRYKLVAIFSLPIDLSNTAHRSRIIEFFCAHDDQTLSIPFDCHYQIRKNIDEFSYDELFQLYQTNIYDLMWIIQDKIEVSEDTFPDKILEFIQNELVSVNWKGNNIRIDQFTAKHLEILAQIDPSDDIRDLALNKTCVGNTHVRSTYWVTYWINTENQPIFEYHPIRYRYYIHLFTNRKYETIIQEFFDNSNNFDYWCFFHLLKYCDETDDFEFLNMILPKLKISDYVEYPNSKKNYFPGKEVKEDNTEKFLNLLNKRTIRFE